MPLKNHTSLFRQNKLHIVKSWLKRKDILALLSAHNINKELFVKQHALQLFDFYFDFIEKKGFNEQTLIIHQLIIFLKNKKITSSQLFTLFTAFKDAILKYVQGLNLDEERVSSEIIKAYEEIFKRILQEYSKTIQEVNGELEKSLLMVDKYIIMSRTNPKGIITKVSQAFCDISGFSEDELIGQSHNIVRDPCVSDEFYKQLWSVIASGKTWQGEIRNKNKKGELYWVYATIQPYFNENNEIIYYDAIRQDITSKKAVEEQHHMLVEQSKYAAMGEMISMIAHQWRQPLQAVSILVQKLPLTKMLEGEITDEVLDGVVQDVSLQLDYMSNTIDDFKDFFKPSKNKTKVQMSYLIEQALSFLSYMFKVDTINLEIKTKEDFELEVYDREIIQVLINILKNAKDALVEKGISKKHLIIHYYQNNQKAYIEIQDNAGGVPTEIMNRIFEPYFSTKENKNGTGLGLYMSKMIIEQHSSGNLSVKNQNDGAMFKIELPLDT